MVMSVEEGQKHPDHQGLIHSQNLSLSSSSYQGQAIMLGYVWCCGRTWSASSLDMLEYVQERKRLSSSLRASWVVKGESGHDVKFT